MGTCSCSPPSTAHRYLPHEQQTSQMKQVSCKLGAGSVSSNLLLPLRVVEMRTVTELSLSCSHLPENGQRNQVASTNNEPRKYLSLERRCPKASAPERSCFPTVAPSHATCQQDRPPSSAASTAVLLGKVLFHGTGNRGSYSELYGG